jgi:hypothetical protein
MICSRLITIVVVSFAAVASAASETKDKPLGIEHEGTEMKTTDCEMI